VFLCCLHRLFYLRLIVAGFDGSRLLSWVSSQGNLQGLGLTQESTQEAGRHAASCVTLSNEILDHDPRCEVIQSAWPPRASTHATSQPLMRYQVCIMQAAA
jgi:hypothetical protein